MSARLPEKPVLPDCSIKMPQPEWSAALLAGKFGLEQADTVCKSKEHTNWWAHELVRAGVGRCGLLTCAA